MACIILFLTTALTPGPCHGGEAMPLPQVTLIGVAQHKKCLRTIAWSPDGKLIATGTRGSSSIPERTHFRLIDAATRKDTVRPRTYWSDVRRITFSTDGKRVAIDASKIQVVDVATANVVCTLKTGHIGFVQNDSMIAVRALGKGIELAEVQTGRVVRTVAGDSRYEYCEASPNGKYIAVFTDTCEVQVIHTDTWQSQTVRRIEPDRLDPVRYAHILWSPDSRRIFVYGEGYFRGREASPFVYDVPTATIVELDNTSVSAGAFSADGDRFLGLGDPTGQGECQVFCTRTGKVQGSLNLHNGKRTCVAFSPDGAFLASGGSDNLLKIWRLTRAEQP